MSKPDMTPISRFPDLEKPGRERLNQILRLLILTTRGDLLTRGATYLKRLAIGANETILVSDGSDLAYKTPAEYLAMLSSSATAAFAWNGQAITQVLTILFSTATELTMDTNGAITISRTVHTVDTFEDAASDDLVTINGATTAPIFIVIRPAHTDRTVVVKHGAGNIELLGGADITLDDITDHLMLFWDATNSKWVDIGGSDAAIQITTHEAAADPHTGYVKESEFTAAEDILVGTGAGALVKKTPAEVMAILSAEATAAFDLNGQDLANGGVIFLTEQAAAEADVAGKGQFWTKTATPNQPWFTNDAGDDMQLGRDTITTKTTTATLAVAEGGIILCSASASYTITLPAASGNTGLMYKFIRTDDTDGYIITVDGDGTETIGAYLTATLTHDRAILTIVCDGSNWQIVNDLTLRQQDIWRTGNCIMLPTSSGWTSTTSGTGSATNQEPMRMYSACGTDNDAYADLYAPAFGFNSGDASYGRVDWSKTVIIMANLARYITATNSEHWWQLKDADGDTSHSDLTVQGIGVVMKNLDLYGESYGSAARAETSLGVTMTDPYPHQIVIVCDRGLATPSVRFYVDGALKASHTTANTVPSAGASANTYMHLSSHAGNPAGDKSYNVLMLGKIWQAR